jgi:polyferredoxin
MLKKYWVSICGFLIFEIIAIILWQIFKRPFYLFNFSYIGFFGSVGIGLMIAKHKHARRFTEFFIGAYMLIVPGILGRENMQIVGFFYYTFSGLFYAAFIHYLIAKIIGPFIWGRGWCGYACWTAMILDLLPNKIPQNPRKEKLGFLRIGIFIISIFYFCFIFIYKREIIENIMFISFIIGNIIYYSVGIILAFTFKDNRAFCKYICPITVFLKPASYFALWRRKVDHDKCTLCNKCKKACPMDVDLLDDRRKRKNGTECIQCLNCRLSCPQKAIK